jgi:putative aldouronate transport system substrate-binding protein
MHPHFKRWAIVAMVLCFVSIASCEGETGKGETVKEEDRSPSVQESVRVAATGFPIVDRPITIRMSGAKAPTHSDWNQMMVFQEYEKLTHIRVEFDAIPQNAFIEKRNLQLTSGEVPDAYYRARLSPYDEVNYGSRGILIPLNDLIDRYAPHIVAMFDKYPEIRKSITSPDGKIYSLPQVVDYLAPQINQKPWINKKWLDQLGLPVPTSTEDYYRTLKAFKEGDPNGNGKQDEIPLAGDDQLALIAGLRGAWGLGNTGNRNEYFDLGPDGKVRFYPTDSRYRELLAYLNKLYREGLIDPEIFTTGRAQLISKETDGLAGSLFISNTAQTGEYMDDYVGMPALTGPHGDHLYSAVVPLTQIQGTFAITNRNKYPEATMRWVDYFYSEQGSKFFRMGVEGVTYRTLPNGEIQYTDEINHNAQGLNLDQAVGRFTPWSGGGVPHLIMLKYDKTGNSMPSALASAKLLEPDIPPSIWPSFLFTAEEQNRLNALTSDIFTYVREMRVKFIAGAVPFSEWDNYVDTIRRMKVDELNGIYQAAYDRERR